MEGSVMSSSPRAAFKKAGSASKRVSWGDDNVVSSHMASSTSHNNVYGGWGLASTKIIPNIEDLRAKNELHQSPYLVLTAAVVNSSSPTDSEPGSPVGALAQIAQEKRRWEKQKRISQLDVLRSKSHASPWRIPKYLEIPAEIQSVRSYLAESTSSQVTPAAETIEIPIKPRATVIETQSETLDIEEPEDTYDPAMVQPDDEIKTKPSRWDSEDTKRKIRSRWESDEVKRSRWSNSGESHAANIVTVALAQGDSPSHPSDASTNPIFSLQHTGSHPDQSGLYSVQGRWERGNVTWSPNPPVNQAEGVPKRPRSAEHYRIEHHNGQLNPPVQVEMNNAQYSVDQQQQYHSQTFSNSTHQGLPDSVMSQYAAYKPNPRAPLHEYQQLNTNNSSYQHHQPYAGTHQPANIPDPRFFASSQNLYPYPHAPPPDQFIRDDYQQGRGYPDYRQNPSQPRPPLLQHHISVPPRGPLPYIHQQRENHFSQGQHSQPPLYYHGAPN